MENNRNERSEWNVTEMKGNEWKLTEKREMNGI